MSYCEQAKATYRIPLFLVFTYALLAYPCLRYYQDNRLNYETANKHSEKISRGGDEFQVEHAKDELVASETWKVDSKNYSTQTGVTLPEDYDSLFYLADVEPVIKEAIRGVIYYA